MMFLYHLQTVKQINLNKGKNMKTLLTVMSILTILFLASCKQKQKQPQAQDAQPKHQNSAVADSEKLQKMPIADIHTVIVQEVIQGRSYTYLKAKEKEAVFWMAVLKSQTKAGETISFREPLEMKNFTSKELNRTFETIYFISEIIGDAPATTQQQAPAKKKIISIEPAKGGISIAELFSNRDSYADKIVRIRGQVTKVNQAIMGKNWVHLQDGTGEAGSNDLIVTTQDDVTIGDVVIFEGKISLNKDFGSGYSYELIMEQAKTTND
jgi:hypothetical protein